MRGWALLLLLGAAMVCAQPSAPPSHSARLSLVIDDLGQNLTRDRRVLALPGPVAMAILPDTPHATELAREAYTAGKTVMLHCPWTQPKGLFPGIPNSRPPSVSSASTRPYVPCPMPVA